MLIPTKEVYATPEEVQRARDEYQTDEIEIDDDACVSRCEDGSLWVQAWVWLPSETES